MQFQLNVVETENCHSETSIIEADGQNEYDTFCYGNW